MLSLNLLSQEKPKTNYRFKLSPLSEKILDMFVNDPMNISRIDASTCSLVLSFGNVQDSTIEMCVMDNELLNSCVNDVYVANYKSFNIFYNGTVLSKYIIKYKVATGIPCYKCDSIFKTQPKGKEIIFKNYDGSIYEVKKGTTIKNIKFVRIQGG